MSLPDDKCERLAARLERLRHLPADRVASPEEALTFLERHGLHGRAIRLRR